MVVEAKVQGLPDFKRELLALPEKLRKRALRNALAAAARVVRNEARLKAPVLAAPILRAGKLYRKPGTLRDAIVVRTSKRDRREGNVGVFVNVRPAKGAVFRNGVQVQEKQRGANSPNDPFYWRWLEFGRKGRPGEPERQRVARVKVGGVVVIKGIRRRRALAAVGPIAPIGFLRAGAARLDDALKVFIAKLRPAIDKLNKGQTP